MKTIYLIRHGQTDQNSKVLIQGRGDFLLNETGRRQAHEAAELLKNIKIDCIYSSPLKRAYETASIINKDLDKKLSIHINNGLLERDFGKAEGKMVNSIDFEKVINGQMEGAEKNCDLEKRANATLKEIAENEESDNILIVAHSHFIKAFIISLKYKDFNYYSSLANASITKIEYDSDFRIKEINKN